MPNLPVPEKECRTVVVGGDGQPTRTLIGQTPLSPAHSRPIHFFLLVLVVFVVFIFVSGLVLYYNYVAYQPRPPIIPESLIAKVNNSPDI